MNNEDRISKIKELINKPEDISIDPKGRNFYYSILSSLRRNKSIDIETYYKVMSKIEVGADNYLNNKINKVKRIRNKATTFTSKDNVRKKVFNRHGKICLRCGSTDDIQLDHVKAVSRGGQNKIDNLQPLCKSCNVSKGTKNIDYR